MDPWVRGRRVSEMQAKLHRWAAADPGRRFDDLFNFVHDPATLIVAFDRVAGNTGSRSPGVDGLTVADVEDQIGVPGFLDDLRAQLKTGTFRPPPSRAGRERSAPSVSRRSRTGWPWTRTTKSSAYAASVVMPRGLPEAGAGLGFWMAHAA